MTTAPFDLETLELKSGAHIYTIAAKYEPWRGLHAGLDWMGYLYRDGKVLVSVPQFSERDALRAVDYYRRTWAGWPRHGTTRPQLIIRVDGELGDELSDEAPSFTRFDEQMAQEYEVQL